MSNTRRRDKVKQLLSEGLKGDITEIETVYEIWRVLKTYKPSNEDLIEPIGEKRIERLLIQDNGKCVYCGTPVYVKEKDGWIYDDTATIDHVIPKSKGGINHIDNTVLCCNRCNSEKENKLLFPHFW